MKVALYARVSTDEQDTKGQEERLKQWASLYQHEVVGLWRDKQSGKDDNREQFQIMLGIRGYNAIVVTKLDRVMRSLIHLENLIAALDRRKIALISIDDGIDTSGEGDDPSRQLIRRIIGSVAEWERKQIVSRVNEGMARAKKYGTKTGKPIGRPRLPDDKVSTDALRMRERRRTKPPSLSLNTSESKIEVEQSSRFVRVKP